MNHARIQFSRRDFLSSASPGLPILRTSVDHGTAFDIAGQNKANAENMKAAMRLAVMLAQNRRARG